MFDLGKTLEDGGQLIQGAEEVLSSIKEMQDSNGKPVAISLVSNFDKFVGEDGEEGHRLSDVKPLQVEYYNILQRLGISSYFEPLYKYVTLSTEIGVRKPDKRIFRAAIDYIERDLPFENILFITEEPDHVEKVRQIGMKAIHFKGPGQNTGEIDHLIALIPRVKDFLA